MNDFLEEKNFWERYFVDSQTATRKKFEVSRQGRGTYGQYDILVDSSDICSTTDHEQQGTCGTWG